MLGGNATLSATKILWQMMERQAHVLTLSDCLLLMSLLFFGVALLMHGNLLSHNLSHRSSSHNSNPVWRLDLVHLIGPDHRVRQSVHTSTVTHWSVESTKSGLVHIQGRLPGARVEVNVFHDASRW